MGIRWTATVSVLFAAIAMLTLGAQDAAAQRFYENYEEDSDAWRGPPFDSRRRALTAFAPARRVAARRMGGKIVVDTRSRSLTFRSADGSVRRYGIGVGRDGFRWKGSTHIGRKAVWPSWTPPAAMRRRQPYLPAFMRGGPGNPLGARALYLYTGGRDTMFRIHGTNERWSIGRAVSSGCIRMLNEDVIDLYSRVSVGTRVVVL